MKKAVQVLTGALVLASFTGVPVHADEHMRAQPVELYACTFREGKSMKDLEKANTNFKKWADDNTSGYSAWMITPQFRSAETEFDVGWIGGYQSAEHLGATIDKWVNESGGVSQAYYDTVDCSHALMTSYDTGAPDEPPGDGVVWFSRCSLEDETSLSEAASSHAGVTTMMREMGTEGSSWMFVPGLGSADADFDYYHVAAWPSYPAFAKAWEAYVNEGGMEKATALYDGVASCKSPNLYDARLIVEVPADR